MIDCQYSHVGIKDILIINQVISLFTGDGHAHKIETASFLWNKQSIQQ